MIQGTVRKKGNKWYYRFTHNGKRIERAGGDTKEEALIKLNKELNNIVEYHERPSEEYVGTWLLQWVEDYIKPLRSQNTYDKYRRDIVNRINPEIGNIKLNELKPIHIDRFIMKMRKIKVGKDNHPISETTIQKYFGVINTALTKAYKLQLITSNPCSFIDAPKRKKYKANILSLEEFKMLYNSFNEDTYNDYIFKLALDITLETGCRRGEMCGLTWDDIDFDNNSIIIDKALKREKNTYIIGDTKTHNSRTIPISNSLSKKLKEHKILQNKLKLQYGKTFNEFNGTKYDLVFTNEIGEWIVPSRFLQRLKRRCKKLGIEKNIRWHDLRHTNATYLLQSGVNMKVVQERLGHAQFNTTADIYSHVTETMNREATDKLSILLNIN